jgi:hypothetical protein
MSDCLARRNLFRLAGAAAAARMAIASTDFIAADRVCSEAMGVDANWLGWLKYCGEAGVGQWDLSRIDIRGTTIADVRKKYQFHPEIDRQLKWMGPMQELPPIIGWLRPDGLEYLV